MNDLQEQAISLAAQALAVDAAAVANCEPIKHGLTNESWLVRTDEDAVVVRISNTAEDALQIDRVSEAAILAAVDAAGIGAPVLLCDPHARTLVTRYLGEHWPGSVAQESPNIARIAQLLKRLHQVSPPAQARNLDLSQSLAGYFNTLDEQGTALALANPALRQRAVQAAATLQAQAPAVLCHNDVHHLNLIGSYDSASAQHDAAFDQADRSARRLRLIDWEYAGLGAPAFDLASVCVYERFDARQRRQLLDGYAGAAAAAWIDNLELACWLFDYVRELWLAVRAGPSL